MDPHPDDFDRALAERAAQWLIRLYEGEWPRQALPASARDAKVNVSKEGQVKAHRAKAHQAKAHQAKAHQEFAAWLKESPRNAEEFLLTMAVWMQLDALDPRHVIDLQGLLRAADRGARQGESPDARRGRR